MASMLGRGDSLGAYDWRGKLERFEKRRWKRERRREERKSWQRSWDGWKA